MPTATMAMLNKTTLAAQPSGAAAAAIAMTDRTSPARGSRASRRGAIAIAISAPPDEARRIMPNRASPAPIRALRSGI
nr:hypothetical protein [Roseibacterium elongatum]